MTQDKRFLDKVAFLDSQQRLNLIPPETLISQMPIHDHADILDIGAGTGYFTIALAEKTKGTVYALDLDDRMLNVIHQKALERGIINIVGIRERVEDILLAHVGISENSLDFVMASLVLHEVPALSQVLETVYALMNSGGHLLCLEYENDESILEGPPMHIRVGSTELRDLLKQTGVEVARYEKITEATYTILAKKI